MKKVEQQRITLHFWSKQHKLFSFGYISLRYGEQTSLWKNRPAHFCQT
jgi:hypothetical protein